MWFWDRIEKAIIADPDGIYAARKDILKVNKLLILKDYDAVIKKCEEYCETYPKFFNGYLYKGYALYYKDMYEEACKNFNKVIEINPHINSTYDYCGYCHIKLENYQIALSYFERASDLFPTDTHFMESKGLALLYLHEVSEANRLFERAYDIDKSDGLNNTILYLFVHNRFEENLSYINHSKDLEYDNRGQLILNYLEAMNSCMLGKNYSENVERMNKLSKKVKAFNWEFLWIDKWLKEETIKEEKRKFIVEINNQLKNLRDKLDKI